ncbi:hypothetical protein LEP1GSC005_0462 [Leptospira santarosai str. ST188]|uniref:DUF6602 domain-containing protein n=1 Tax=Leptospira santarosai TaxID=28183 RepID=UPI0002BAE5CB|nr:DUF6602 domain-containing protein [Leptospira santarosai]EMF92178.1 hypothetical protein LEP1GSC005_0462 [Leptospira santarosai str. ST188]
MNENEFLDKLRNLLTTKKDFKEIFLEKNDMELKMLQRWYKSILELFKVLNRQKQLINHLRHSGDGAENIFFSELIKFLPERFGIGKGFVINPRFDTSMEQDIILYDKNTASKLISIAHINYFPFHSVMGTIEIKSNLNKSELRKAVLNTISLKKIYYYDSNDIDIEGYKYNSKPSFNDYNVIYSIFAFNSDLTLNELCNELNLLYKNIENKFLKINCIYVLGKGMIIPINEGFSIKYKDIISSSKKYMSYSPEEEAISFLRFVTLYIDHCMIESSKRVLMPLYEEYFYKPMFFKHFIESSLKE